MGAELERAEARVRGLAADDATEGTQQRGADERRARNVVTFPDAAVIDPRDPSTFGYVHVGRVLGPHGLRGHVKVHTESDFAEGRLCRPGQQYVRRPDRVAPRPLQVLSGSRARDLPDGKGAIYIVLFEGSSSREDAAELRGHMVFARADTSPDDLQADEYLVAQVAGCAVRLASDPSQLVGTVVGMLCAEDVTGNPGLGNALLDVEKVAVGGADPERVLIPFVAAIVPHVDLARRSLLVDPVPGLLDMVQPVDTRDVYIRGLLPAAVDGD